MRQRHPHFAANQPYEEGVAPMYKKLLPLVNQFIYVRQGYFSRFYEGKLVEVTPETLTLKAYDDEGKEEACWVLSLATVTEFMTGDRELDELNMRVSMYKTREALERMALCSMDNAMTPTEADCVTSKTTSASFAKPRHDDDAGPSEPHAYSN